MSDKAKAGDPLSISAVTWNKMVDLVSPQVGGESGPGRQNLSYTWMWARNGGGDAVRGEAARITGVLADEASNPGQYLYNPVAQCNDATAEAHAEFVAIWLEPVASGKFGKIAVEGVVIAQVDVTGVGSYAGVNSGGLFATEEQRNIIILYRPTGGGVKNCLVRLTGAPRPAASLECTDTTRPITEIRWVSPKLQARRGPACDWFDILTGVTCSAPNAAPSGLSSTGTTTTSVSVSWTDNSDNEDGFVVEYKAASSSTWITWTTTAANVTSATITGLTPGTSYNFRVAATNAYGTSSYATATISTGAES